jgi:isopenicillin-N N-acyltransferase-like protein
MTILQISCSGTAYEIGRQHGIQAADLVKGSIQFYADMFESYTGNTWVEITHIAETFARNIEREWPKFYEEMKGVADGAGCTVVDIVALNTRTEIVFGLMDPERVISDGCTSLSWIRDSRNRMGQNWDWMEEQKTNIVLLTIAQPGYPVIKIVTEAGIIGKIGLNSSGLAVCLNAVRCSGHDTTKLPLHLALRLVLESETLSQAVDEIVSTGIAGSGFLLLGQDDQSVGLEVTSKTIKRIDTDSLGRIMHSNHLLLQHEGAIEWPEDDSFTRLKRITELTDAHHAKREAELSEDDLLGFFDDHYNKPFSICRWQEKECKDATLFNIIVDLDAKRAVVRTGKVCLVEEEIYLDFE